MSAHDVALRADWATYQLFGAAYRHLVFQIAQSMAGRDLTYQEFQVLSLLAQTEGRQIRVGQMSQILAWERTRLSHQLRRMESSGLIVKVEDADDARGVRVQLSEEGKRRFESTMVEHEANVYRVLLNDLSADERRTLTEVAARIISRSNPTAWEIANTFGLFNAAIAEAGLELPIDSRA